MAGGGDQAAGAVGMGIVRAGAVSATIGTSGVVFAATDQPALEPQRPRPHVLPRGPWTLARDGRDAGRGLSLRWFRDQFGAGPDDGRDPYERHDGGGRHCAAGLRRRAVGAVPDGRAHAASRPARARRAGRARPRVHTRAHVVRAVLEGVAFSLRDSFSIFEEMQVPVSHVRLGGGGARSALWRQIQADIYGHPVEIVAAEEGAAYGAALLAGVGAGVWRTVDEACDAVVRVVTRIEPDPIDRATMARQYERYRALYPALKAV